MVNTKGKGNMVELAFSEYEKLKSKDPVKAKELITNKFDKEVCPECGNDDIFNIDNDWRCDECGNVW